MSPTVLPPVPLALRTLVEHLDHLTARADLQDLHKILRQNRATLLDLIAVTRFDDKHYCRNLVASGKWYDLLVICWKSGQRSPIHDHAGSACAFKVLTGICSETPYSFSESGQVYPLATTHQPAGAIVATEDDDTHQVSNLQPSGVDLVTLHIYSPPLKSMHTFSITGEGTKPFASRNPDPESYYGDAI